MSRSKFFRVLIIIGFIICSIGISNNIVYSRNDSLDTNQDNNIWLQQIRDDEIIGHFSKRSRCSLEKPTKKRRTLEYIQMCWRNIWSVYPKQKRKSIHACIRNFGGRCKKNPASNLHAQQHTRSVTCSSSYRFRDQQTLTPIFIAIRKSLKATMPRWNKRVAG